VRRNTWHTAPRLRAPPHCESGSQRRGLMLSVTKRSSVSGVRYLLALTLVAAALGQLRDAEYQEHAKKFYREGDAEAINRGKAIACGLCNLALMAIKGQYTMHREGTLGKKFSEEEGMKKLEKICEKLAPSMAKKMQGYAEDTLMICKRVVREHGQDMLDALAVGDDTDAFCQEEAGLCPMKHDAMLKLAADVVKAENEEGEKEEKRKKKKTKQLKAPAEEEDGSRDEL